jgi:hypothetical protein
MRRKFQEYCQNLPVLGFNSAKYDMNLIKVKIVKVLHLADSEHSFTVKRINSYLCVSNEKLRFLDICQYLPPGSNCKFFLKAYKVKEQKGFFPYEWFDDVSKLENPSLPGAECFYSELKGCNVLEEYFLKWSEGNKQGPMPPTLEENYANCKAVWEKHNMTSFRDYLEYYNDLDVEPFVECIKRFQEFYKREQLDVFKTAISVPGIARKMLFQEAKRLNVYFSLFGKKHEDLYNTVKQNIVGGPSIIFTRHCNDI